MDFIRETVNTIYVLKSAASFCNLNNYTLTERVKAAVLNIGLDLTLKLYTFLKL